MKKLIALFFLSFALIAYAAPVQTSIDITLSADVEFVEDYEAAARHMHALAKKAARYRAQEAQYKALADSMDASVAAMGVRVRRRLVTHKAALGAILPAVLTDIAVVRSGSAMRLKLNAEATTPSWD